MSRAMEDRLILVLCVIGGAPIIAWDGGIVLMVLSAATGWRP